MKSFHLYNTGMRILFFVIMAVVILYLYSQAEERSIAATLPDYQKSTFVQSIAGINASNISSIGLHQPDRKLYLTDNSTAMVYELTGTGTLVRTLTSQGVADPEGLCHFRDDIFLVADERSCSIFKVEIPPTGTAQLNWYSVPALQLGTGWGNSSLEGVSYCASNNTIFAVKETSPSQLYRITLDDAGEFVSAFENDPFNIEDHEGDAADVAALEDGNIIIVNQERKRLEGYNPDGDLLSMLSLEMTQPEGIAIDTADGTIFLSGEPREFCVLKKPPVRLCRESGGKSNPSIQISSIKMTGGQFTAIINLSSRSAVTIECFLLDGRRFHLYNSIFNVGSHQLHFPLKKFPPGIRLLQLTAGHIKRAFVVAHS